MSASGAFGERRTLLLAASMLKQEELAFLKALSAVRQSPARLQELRKALAANKEKRAVALRKAGGSAGASTRRQQEIKRKANHLGLDTSGEPATRRPAPELTPHRWAGCPEQPAATETTLRRGCGRASYFAAQWAA